MAQGPNRAGEENAHDVLAAEAFAVPAPDPVLSHHRPVRLPDDPTGIPEAHDILAAEEFAMPAPMRKATAAGTRGALARGAEAPRRAGLLASLALLGAVMLRRRRRR